MQWNVLYENFNNKEIEIYNIFKCGGFAEDIKKLCKEKITKEEFSDKLRRRLMYYFWSKCEVETVITSWPPYIDKKELDRLNEEYEDLRTRYGHDPYKINVVPTVGKKIDIYDQVMLNWDVFVDYVWENR